MKKLFTTSVALAGVFVTQAAVAAEGNVADGFGSVALGYNSLNGGDYSGGWVGDAPTTGSDSGKADGLSFEVRGSVATPISGNFAGQLDGVFTRNNLKANAVWCVDCTTVHLDETTVATHFFYRNSSKYLVGLVAQRTAASTNAGDGLTNYYVGGEAQAYFGKTTLYGQVTYGTLDSHLEAANGVNVALQARYFVQPNMMLALKGTYEHITETGVYNSSPWEDKYNSWLIGGRAEYRLPQSRFSTTLDFDYTGTKAGVTWPGEGWVESEKYHNYRALVGFKISFGPGTLFERDRQGASLDPVRPVGASAFYGWDNGFYHQDN